MNYKQTEKELTDRLIDLSFAEDIGDGDHTTLCCIPADAMGESELMIKEEGIFAGISAAGACWVAQQIAQREENATIVFIVCDRGDRYLSTGVFPA